MSTPTDTPPEASTVPDSEMKGGCSAMPCSDVWEYSEYSATLRLNGKLFALITPDGHNAISKDDAAKLLAVLNRPNS